MNPDEEKTIRDIAEFFKEHGYTAANSEGIANGVGKESCIGILAPRKKLLNMKHLKIYSPIKSEYFANLYLNPDQELDKIDKEWSLIVYGKKNEYRFDKLLEELEEKHHVNIQKFLNPKKHIEYDALL
jgi:hypothetical protein